jgi:hypothetical protein
MGEAARLGATFAEWFASPDAQLGSEGDSAMAFCSSRTVRGRSGRRRPPRIGVAIGVAALLVASLAPVASARSASRVLHPLQGVHPTLSQRYLPSAREAARNAGNGPALQPTASKPFLSVGRDRHTSVTVAHHADSGAATPGATMFPTSVLAPLPGSVNAVTAFNGLAMGPYVPADPWVAASGSYVVQVVNSAATVSNRSGAALLTVPTASLFALPTGYTAADARILWDATHGRWVGVALVYPEDLSWSDNALAVVVSDSADPTGGWRSILLTYGTLLPDYPSISSSGDKLVVTADIFDPFSGFSFLGADFETFTWGSILAGGVLTLNECSDSTLIHARAAQSLSSGNDVHVILEDAGGFGSDGNVDYVRITGSGACASFVDFTDLSASLGYQPFSIGLIPSPRQPGGNLGSAIDERPTDAIWQSGNLYWVATQPVSYDAGSTFNDEVAVYRAVTHAAGTVPTLGDTFRIDPGDGVDAFMGGIGVSRNGTAFVTYSQGSSSDPISWWANRLFNGGTVATPLLLGTSDADFLFQRWGDFAGVAMDPTGTGAVWVTHMLANTDGGWKTEVDRLLVDADNPTTPASAPAATPVVTQTVGSPRFRLTWGASTDASSGGVTYWLEESIDAGAYDRFTAVAGTSTVRTLLTGHTYRYRVLAMDILGHSSAYAYGPTITPSLAQSPTSKAGTWKTQTATSYSGGGTWYASGAGATASYTSTGIRSIGFVTTKASSRGSFRVYIDGVLKATISAYSTTTAYRQLVYQFTWATPGTHTMKIYVLGTAGHPRVDVDAFLVLK